MTPTAEPTTLHVVLENAGGGDGISAVESTLLAAFISALVAVATTWLNLRHNNKKHLTEINERKADRLFEARREVASRCLGAVQVYKAQQNNTEMQTEASEELRGKLDQDAGELAVLFSRELSAIASRISTDLLVIRALEVFSKVDELLNKSEDKSNEDTEPDSSDEEGELDSKFYKDRLSGLFEELTEAFSKELGTYEEPPVKKEA